MLGDFISDEPLLRQYINHDEPIKLPKLVRAQLEREHEHALQQTAMSPDAAYSSMAAEILSMTLGAASRPGHGAAVAAAEAPVTPPPGWERMTSPEDGEQYDLVAPVLLGTKTFYLGYNFAEGKRVAAERFLKKRGLPVRPMRGIPVQFTDKLISHLSFVQERAFNQVTEGKKVTLKPVETASIVTCKWIPKEAPLLYRKPVEAACFEKLMQFNKAQDQDKQLSASEVECLRVVTEAVTSGASLVSAPSISTAVAKLVRWKAIFAAPVLDVLRALFLSNDVCVLLRDVFLPPKQSSIVEKLLFMSPIATAPFATHVLALRALTNATNIKELRPVLFETRGLLDKAGLALKSNDRVMRLSAANLLVNIAVAQPPLSLRKQCIETSCAALNAEKDEDVVFALLVTVGTLICNNSEAAQRALNLAIRPKLLGYNTQSQSQKVKQTAEHLLRWL
eukprot:TRINITY_DN575_c0_g1_i1.p1 TRINITY_DN575_c0_g1~~TRINITY_DN575_c0_g1_i1.p1  ORF type:complete len:450 (-),score=114.68 TRINITY_DN575_c0_g1_i1:381-1730(-)